MRSLWSRPVLPAGGLGPRPGVPGGDAVQAGTHDRHLGRGECDGYRLPAPAQASGPAYCVAEHGGIAGGRRSPLQGNVPSLTCTMTSRAALLNAARPALPPALAGCLAELSLLAAAPTRATDRANISPATVPATWCPERHPCRRYWRGRLVIERGQGESATRDLDAHSGQDRESRCFGSARVP